jgi:hypothetical protein
MKTIIGILVLSAMISGCANLTPTQKKVAGIVAGVLVVGAIAAHQVDSGKQTTDTASGKDPFHPACQMQKGC